MIGVFMGAAFLIAAITSFMVSIFYQQSEQKFQQRKIDAYGTIAGFVRDDYSVWDTPQIRLTVDGKDVICRSKGVNMTAQTHPHETKVKIVYTKTRAFGGTVYDIRVDEDGFRPPSSSVLLNILRAVAVVLLTVAVIFFIMSLRGKFNKF